MRAHVFDTAVVVQDGFECQVTYYYDDAEPPWDNECGHGPVRHVRSRNGKRPGERPVHTDRGDVYLYDWQAAAKLAREEWGVKDIQAAVQADFDYIRGYIQGRWWYCGVKVALTLHPQYETTLWRVDSLDDYHKACARELAGEVLAEYLDDIEKGKLKPRSE